MIRKCTEEDFRQILDIINDGASAYKGIIPADRWKEPYMTQEELKMQMDDGVFFWCYEEEGEISGVMGLQDKEEVMLIRHAYVRTEKRAKGIGTRLLQHLVSGITKPILIGTWGDAVWAISFYQKHGFQLTGAEEKERLLRTYWKIPERQVLTSVVLSNEQPDSQ